MSKQLELQEKRFELQMQMHQEQIQKLNSGIPISVSQTAQTSIFEPFNPSQELWKDYSDRFFTFVKANAISEQRMPHVFLSNQSRETFQLIKTAASQMPTPKNINALSWGEIFSIMSTNFSQRTFVVRERHRFYTELKHNATTFSSNEFQSWCKSRGITCISGAPYHPATNGTAERFVQTFKQAMKKSNLSIDLALYEFLLQYRRTPGATGLSPSELLNGRQIRAKIDTFIPHEKEEMKDKLPIPKVYQFVKSDAPCYARNFKVHDERSPKWLPATIIKILGYRHALVRLEKDHRVFKRHFEQLRPRYIKKPDVDFPLYLPGWVSNKPENFDKVPEKEEACSQPVPRRSTRIRRPPAIYQAPTWKRRRRK
ncbi:hypothetical protein RF11_09005 [Thelohanellus kitauei]|uniref:Integrase catalytic domain-containing protein n=1 Tax=Thelohanellus kitauei TaxID=669202 RepID=A0A0C2IBX3_THEKT|nr:hypothetical protein RF11_09005 [Thelohanellus kitauei]